jgi:hypothetical protein
VAGETHDGLQVLLITGTLCKYMTHKSQFCKVQPDPHEMAAAFTTRARKAVSIKRSGSENSFNIYIKASKESLNISPEVAILQNLRSKGDTCKGP